MYVVWCFACDVLSLCLGRQGFCVFGCVFGFVCIFGFCIIASEFDSVDCCLFVLCCFDLTCGLMVWR